MRRWPGVGLTPGRPPLLHHRRPRVLVLGGARSGKSAVAEQLLRRMPAVLYVATADPAWRAGDREWSERITTHRRRRPAHWRTEETADLVGVLSGRPVPVLVDSLTQWLTRVMDAAGCWADGPPPEPADGLGPGMHHLEGAWRRRRSPAVLVSDEVGSGVVPGSASGRRFRDELGRLNQRMAAVADEVWLVVAGIPTRLR